MIKTLDEIAIEERTDKSSQGHSYCQYYDQLFWSFSSERFNLLEIGIDEGNSLKMWARYFSNANIHGIDVRNGYEYLTANIRIKTHVVDQSKEGDLIVFAEQYIGYFKIICDDGSHQSEDMILTFQTLFPYLQSGGYYILEDLLCAYDQRWCQGISILDRIKEMVDEVQMNRAIPNDKICANKHEAVNKYDSDYFSKNIEWIFVACGTAIIKKL